MESRFGIRALVNRYDGEENARIVDVCKIDYSQGIFFDNNYEEFTIAASALLQCTGLVAKSSYRGDSEEDRLIYEGDIVHTNNNATYVEYKDSYDQLEFVRITHGCGFYRNDCVIVGNVHEHKKLLDKHFWEYEANTDENIEKARKKESEVE